MNVNEAIIRRRSVRQYQDRPVEPQLLQKLLEVMPYYMSPANLQPLKFLAVSDPEVCRRVFPALKWAAYLPGYTITREQEPQAYIVILGDKSVCKEFQFAAGSATTALSLAAYELGLDSCCLASADRNALYPLLGIDPEEVELLYVISLGYGAHGGRTVPMEDSCRYYLEGQDFVVPKRRLEDIVRFDRWDNG